MRRATGISRWMRGLGRRFREEGPPRGRGGEARESEGEDDAGFSGGGGPDGFDLGEWGDLGGDGQVCGGDGFEDAADGLGEDLATDAADAAAHEGDGGGAEECGGELYGGLAAGAADLDEADGAVPDGFGEGIEDGEGAWAP